AYAQRYGATGQSLGAEFQVNTFTAGYQSLPAVGMGAAGDFVVAWESGDLFGPTQDGSSYGVYAQRYARLVTVESVRPAGRDAAIVPGGVALGPINRLAVTFPGPLATTGAGSALDPANWQLARYGAAVPGAITSIFFGLVAET